MKDLLAETKRFKYQITFQITSQKKKQKKKNCQEFKKWLANILAGWFSQLMVFTSIFFFTIH